MRGVGDGGHRRRQALRPQVLNGGGADVHHQGVDQLYVVPVARRLPIRELQVTSNLGQEGDGCAIFQIAV